MFLKWFTILLILEGERGNQSNIYDTESFRDIPVHVSWSRCQINGILVLIVFFNKVSARFNLFYFSTL